MSLNHLQVPISVASYFLISSSFVTSYKTAACFCQTPSPCHWNVLAFKDISALITCVFPLSGIVHAVSPALHLHRLCFRDFGYGFLGWHRDKRKDAIGPKWTCQLQRLWFQKRYWVSTCAVASKPLLKCVAKGRGLLTVTELKGDSRVFQYLSNGGPGLPGER